MRSFHIRASQAGELDSSFPNGDKPPPDPLPAWGDLSPIQAAITQTTVGTSVSVAVRTALTGAAAATSALGLRTAQGADAAATGFAIAVDNLAISSLTLGSGQLTLVAFPAAGGEVVSSPLNWTRKAVVVTPPPVTFKWSPNFYLLHTTIDSDLANFVQTAKALGRGVAIWTSWAQVEATQGNYTGLVAGSQLMKNIGYCEAVGVPYLVQVQDRSFGGSVRNAPSYVPLYQKPSGTIPKIWQADGVVMGYWLAMIGALSAALDSRPLCMGFRGEESDIGFSTDQYAAAGFNEVDYLNQMLRQNTYLTTVFPHCMKFIGLNFMGKQSQLETLAKDTFSKTASGLAAMGSDLIPGKRTTWAYQVFIGNTWNGSAWVSGGTDYRNKASYNAQVQDPEMGGKAGNFLPSEFFAEALAILISYLVVFDKNYAWPLSTGNKLPNEQTYWDSTQAANDTFRWKAMLQAHPEWATYQTAPVGLSV